MKVGDSFFVEGGLPKDVNVLRGAGMAWAFRHNPSAVFRAAEVKGGVRCWRIE